MVDKTIRTEIQASVTGRESVTGFGADIDGVGQAAAEAGQQAEKASTQVSSLTQELQRKSSEIKAALLLERSEIDLQNQHLELQRLEQQEIAKTAQARGNEQGVQQAQNRLRQIEAEQLGLVARAKRAEAQAIDQAAQARRQELAALGPMDAAATKEIAAAENHARALRTEAAAADMASARVRQLGADHSKAAASASELGGRISGLTSLLGQMAGAMSAAFGFRELVRAAADMEQLRAGLEAVSRDSQQAGKDLEFVRAVAARAGADVRETGKAWLGLAAATKGTAVEGEPTRQVFDAVAISMGKAGKSSAETSNALLALQQMASKGVIQMEELRGQLGEALPGALQATAKGLGLTTKELIDMVEAGGLTATDLFPALSRGLKELYGGAQAVKTLNQEITSATNAFTSLAQGIGDAGGLSILKRVAQEVSAAFTELEAGFVATGKSIGVVVGAIASMDFSGVKQAFADIEAESRDKLAKAALNNDVLKKSIQEGKYEALKAALAQQEAGQAASAAGQAAAGAVPSWASLIALYSKAGKDLADMTALAEKTAAVKNAEASAVVALASAYGTEKEQREAQAAAAATQAESLERIAVFKKSELVLLENELAALQALGKEQIQADPARQKQLQDLEKEISLRRTVADSAQAQAREAKINAEVAKAEAKAIEDNSGKVKDLGQAYEKARSNLELMRRLQSMGIKTQEDVAAAENALVKAAKEYKDALSDQVQAAKASQITKVSEAQATVSLLENQKRLASQSEQIAALMGNETAVRRAKILQLEIDIKLTKAKADVARAEAEGTIEVANATLMQMKVLGEINPVKEAEINASIRSARAKLNEADAIRKSAEVAAQELSNLRNGANTAGSGISKSMDSARESVASVGDAAKEASGAFDGMRVSADAAAEAAGRAADKYGPVNADKYGQVGGTPPPPKLSDADKRSGYQTVDNMGNASRTSGNALGTRLAIIEWLKASGLDEALAEYVSKDFVDANGNVAYMDNGGQKKWRGNTMSQALSNVVDYYKYGQGKEEAEAMAAEAAKQKAAKEAKTATKAAPAASPAPAPTSSAGSSGSNGGSSGVSYVSHNYIQGRPGPTTLNYADAESQRAGDELIRQLASGKGVAQ